MKSTRRGFSLAEMLVAITITATLLTATLQAFDASWRSYKMTTESASTHVVSRIVITRLLTMLRTGTDFGPYPADFYDSSQNPLVSDSVEFITQQDRMDGTGYVTRIEERDGTGGMKELWYLHIDPNGGAPITLREHPLLTGVRDAMFILEYEPGPRLIRATVDLTITPNDDDAIKTGLDTQTPAIRLVASAVPRQR